ncbi:MAG: tRNA pseudouridine(38-40) synthase TruA, partial [bacterium]|nr:tRNA pseudouridine(38-40) synthase TruA [bacterium]MDW8163634.1 tRNA pseudouridine(38-40) synthase TruA [Candidatus Omnitrophota bacterium]
MEEKNFKIVISFLGKDFYGWQKQKNKETIQGCIENVCKEIFNTEFKLIGCGRTDSKVHGINYVANLKVKTRLKAENIKSALNSKLPPTIYIKEVKEVSKNFHSRFSIKRKTYRYVFTFQKSPFLTEITYYVKNNIDIERMKEAAKFFIGEHNFKAFQSSGSNVKDTVRKIYRISIKKKKFPIDEDIDLIIIDIEGSGFLYKM